MTEQEWRNYYDQACSEVDHVTIPSARVAFNMILQMLAHLKSQTNNLNARITVVEEHPRG